MVLNNEVEIAIENVEKGRGRPQDQGVFWLWLVQKQFITSASVKRYRDLSVEQLCAICKADLELDAKLAEAKVI